jgi:conserved oligomeric Golgi complex subunit 6
MATPVEGRVKEVIVDSRINKVLAMRTDSVAMLEALDAISEFYVSNTVEARRALRQDIELHNINLGKKFLAEFDQVRSKIENVEKISDRLEKECKLLASRVSEADENMKSFMEKASELETRRNFFIEQGKEIASFLSRFQLSNEEIDTLYRASIDTQHGARSFFEALQRLRGAYADCKTMVEKHSYSAGFELLDALGQHQDMAYQRLFEWVKGKCDSLAETGSTEEIDLMLQTAIRYLRKLPIYFAQCQDLVVNSRRSQLVQKFVVALTQGGPSGQVFRAIDLHAHDAVRYVGDMLAWMHQAVASEEEFLEAVFGEARDGSKSSDKAGSRGKEAVSAGTAEGADKEGEGDGEVDGEGSAKQQALVGLSVTELLARCLQGLGRPLRVRITQTLESRAGLEVLYTLTDLLCFYEQTFGRLVPIENAVHSTVKGCLNECKRLFISGLNKQADVLVQSPAAYPLDLTAAHATKECCRQIHEILRVQSGAMSAMPMDPNDPCYVDTVLGSIIQPLLQSCRMGAQSLSQGDMAIFMLNNVSSIHHEIADATKHHDKSDSSHSWFEHLNTEATTWVDVLIAEEVSRTLRRSDMDKLLELMEVIPTGIVASQQTGLSPDRVGTVMRAFYASLFSTVTQSFDRLQDPALRERTRKGTAEAVAQAHEKIHAVVSNPIHGYDVSNILSHSPEDVRVLLGCS